MKNVKIIKDYSFDQNAYLLIENKEVIIIDPGYQYKEIEREIVENNLIIKAILLTHYHFDHVEGVNYLADKFKIKCFVHRGDYELLKNNKMADVMNIKHQNVKENNIEIFNEKNRLPFDIEFIHTPGHSKGSVCYLWKDNIFTGDTLFADSIGRYDFEDSNQIDLIKSLKKLKNITRKLVVYPGHGAYGDFDIIKKNNLILKEI